MPKLAGAPVIRPDVNYGKKFRTGKVEYIVHSRGHSYAWRGALVFKPNPGFALRNVTLTSPQYNSSTPLEGREEGDYFKFNSFSVSADTEIILFFVLENADGTWLQTLRFKATKPR